SRGVYVAPPGCSAAWHADVFRIFGPLREDVIFEDRAFSFRASLMHGMGVVREDLVSYRINDFSASKTEAGFGAAGIRNFKEKLGARSRRERNFLAVYRGMARDLAVARAEGLLPDAQADRAEAAVAARIEECETKLDWWNLGLIQKCRSIECAPLRSRLGKLVCLLPLKH
ncbi:MAG: hypothetical protein HKN82_12385, partial [Akkermansiaceae bacterium]|nr:hypothetical protein [Akkermansiaceae bacterium]